MTPRSLFSDASLRTTTPSPTVLVVGVRELGVLETLVEQFQARGVVVTVASYEQFVRDWTVDGRAATVLLDIDNPEAEKLDGVAGQKGYGRLRWIAIAPQLSEATVTLAVRLGVVDVVSSSQELPYLVTLATYNDVARHSVMTPRRGLRSVEERCADYVLGAATAPYDLHTVALWARYIGVSYSSLREHCRLAGVSARRAKDLARCLRAGIQARREDCAPASLLNVGDARTLRGFIERAGPSYSRPDVSPLLLLRTQRFVSSSSSMISTLRRIIVERRDSWT